MDDQKAFFERVLVGYTFKYEMYADVAQRMKVSEYKAKEWIKGKRAIKFPDLNLFISVFHAKKYDLFPFSPGMIGFHFVGMNVLDSSDYIFYLKTLAEHLENYADSQEAKITLVVKEVPEFYLMAYPYLVYFKWFAFLERTGERQSSFEEFVEEMEELGFSALFERIHKAYSKANSVEVWDDFVLYNFLQQLKIMSDINCFDLPSSVLELMDQLQHILSDVKQMIESGVKTAGGTLTFYRNQQINESEFMLLESKRERSTNLKIQGAHVLYTDDNSFSEDSKQWVKAALHSSIAMGLGAKRELSLYFQDLNKEIEKLNKELKITRKQKK